MEAIFEGRADTVDLLIEHGADVNAPITTGKYTGLTPLSVAVLENNDNAIELLISNGADINATITTE